MTYGIVRETVTAISIDGIHAVTLYWSRLWCDPEEIGRRYDLQLLLICQARSILGALHITPLEALVSEAWLTPAPVMLDPR